MFISSGYHARTIPQIVLVTTRIESFPLLVCHSVVGEAIPINPDTISQESLCGVNDLFIVQTTITAPQGKGTYCCHKHQVVICLKFVKSNLLVSQNRSYANDGETHA